MVPTNPTNNGSGGNPNLTNAKYSIENTTNHFNAIPVVSRTKARPAEYAGPFIDHQAKSRLPRAMAPPPVAAATAACAS